MIPRPPGRAVRALAVVPLVLAAPWFAHQAVAQNSSSASYRMNGAAVDSGGGQANSASYSMWGCLTFDPAGLAASSSYRMQVGCGASLTAQSVLPPAIAKAFNPPTMPLDSTSTLTLTITNPTANVDPLTGVSFTDTLPAHLAVATPNGLANTCGGTATALEGSASITLSGGSIAPGGTCSVSVAVAATLGGVHTNTTDPVTSSNGGTGNSAMADLNVTAADLTITKAHVGTFIPGRSGQYILTVSNVGSVATVGPVVVTDTLPAGLAATAISGPGWSCDLAAVSCTRSDVLAAGASWPPITLIVGIAPDAPPTVVNTAIVSGGGDLTAGNDTAADTASLIAAIPVLGGVGAAVLLLLVAAVGCWALARRS